MTASSTSTRDIRSDMSDRARDTVSSVADKAAALADRAGAKIDEAMDSAGSVAMAASDKAREATATTEAVAGNLKSAIDKSLKDQPMTTLALAALAGLAIGALWKS